MKVAVETAHLTEKSPLDPFNRIDAVEQQTTHQRVIDVD